MKFIAIDTSGKFCSVSILLPNNIQESIISDTPLSHSTELAVNIKKMIDKYNISINDLDCILTNVGPGSFTGLRIGISFAKGLCLSSNVPLVPINSFNIIENKIDDVNKSFYICVYSHKNYAYGKRYDNNNKSAPTLIDLNNKVDIPIYISGLGPNKIYDNNIINIEFSSLDLLEFGEKYFKTHATNNLNSIHPIYVDYVNIN